jgi:hypothetical protein
MKRNTFAFRWWYDWFSFNIIRIVFKYISLFDSKGVHQSGNESIWILLPRPPLWRPMAFWYAHARNVKQNSSTFRSGSCELPYRVDIQIRPWLSAHQRFLRVSTFNNIAANGNRPTVTTTVAVSSRSHGRPSVSSVEAGASSFHKTSQAQQPYKNYLPQVYYGLNTATGH